MTHAMTTVEYAAYAVLLVAVAADLAGHWWAAQVQRQIGRREGRAATARAARIAGDDEEFRRWADEAIGICRPFDHVFDDDERFLP